MWNLKHGGGQPSGRSYRRGEKQKAASDLSDSPSSAGSESCASEAPRAAVAASDFLAMSGAVFHRGCPFLGHESTRWMERSRSGLQGRVTRVVTLTFLSLSPSHRVGGSERAQLLAGVKPRHKCLFLCCFGQQWLWSRSR
ncbi:uncharacterized protein VSU04_016159 isoform 2-T6 [Chlamydotis macqueenii]